ncbi:MAG TPA: alanine racemase [Ilumatobacteraceae bacterium]|nr:alanine racemase [Ilumatobacteraceae bacterium]
MSRWAWAEIDHDAIRHNVEVMRRAVAPSAVWAVVKADGYGHGAVDVARTALDAGAEGLCVALVDEGVELRGAGIDAPILLLSEQPLAEVTRISEHRLIPMVYTRSYVDALAALDVEALDVHLKVDTGMQRVGVSAGEAPSLAAAVIRHAPRLRLAGVATHLASADDVADPATSDQLATFEAVLAALPVNPANPVPPAIHAANSAGALAHPSARYSFVRAGIAIYGISPGHGVDHLCRDLRPAMSLRARVAFVKRVAAGSRISYGLRHTFTRSTTVAAVPIGYADGVPRRLFETGGEVLIGGRRRPIVGVVTMDQLMVDVGDDPIAVGDEVVLIGEQGGQRVGAEEWADRLGTIGYEIVCGVSRRIARSPRRSIGD